MKRGFVCLLALALLWSCEPPSAPLLAPPTPTSTPVKAVVRVVPTATPVPTPPPALFAAPQTPSLLSSLGRTLIYEFEVGGKSGYDPRPEAPDARISGVTWGIGYDGHQNAPKVIEADWQALGARNAGRLAATHPYYGRSAQTHLAEVRDIIVAWQIASDVFDRIDVSREFVSARRAYGKADFDSLRPNAQAVLISVGFNRGYSFAGENRREMRAVLALVPKRDYPGMAAQIRASERVWRGTGIYGGMKRRRFAEAKLMETP